MKNKLPKLSFKEEDVMSAIWSSDTAVTGLEISKIAKMSINTVKIVIPKLLEKKYIEVNGLGYSGTTVARKFSPIISAEEYAADQLQAMRTTAFRFSTLHFLEQILSNEQRKIDTLNELEEIIHKIKKEVE